MLASKEESVPLFDKVVAIAALGALGGVLTVRAFRAWADYRLQRRSVDLLVRSVTEAERQERERRP
jgi:hypothetical protein